MQEGKIKVISGDNLKKKIVYPTIKQNLLEMSEGEIKSSTIK